MAKVELGVKRSCLSCDMRFYDFKRSPIICPGCGTEFDPENLVKARKGRAAPKSVAKHNSVLVDRYPLLRQPSAGLTRTNGIGGKQCVSALHHMDTRGHQRGI